MMLAYCGLKQRGKSHLRAVCLIPLPSVEVTGMWCYIQLLHERRWHKLKA